MSQQTIAIPPPAPMPLWKSWLTLKNRYVPPVFITLILLAGQLTYGMLESYERTLLAIAAAVVTELVLSRVFVGKWPNLASAYITGISVGILLRGPAYWPYAVCAAMAITSKYALRVKGRHLFNPSNFAICVVLFLLPASVAMLSIQWGNDFWSLVVIWVLGSVIVWRIHRLHISATYAASFLVLAVLRAWMIHGPISAEISPITGPVYQLFIFFMLTDPKTTVKSKKGQALVAFMVAVLEMFIRLYGGLPGNLRAYAEIYSLFVVGPIAMLIEMWWNSRKARRAPGVVATSAPAPALGAAQS